MSDPVLVSGLSIERAEERLSAFCAEEYAYYDAVASIEPDQIDPMDVLVTVAVNSFVNSADRVRSVHRGLSQACDLILQEIPEDADLAAPDVDLEVVEQLLSAACRVKWVLVPVATKVLHRKRRRLIPMLDSVLIEYYRATGVDVSSAALEDGNRAGTAAMPILAAFRTDLVAAMPDLIDLQGTLASQGFHLSTLRILEVLLWLQTEPRGYYRDE